ncbi:GIY-YIG nuclease family protein [Tamlana crocina]
MKKYYIYILECNDDTFYVGFTSNLEHRIMQHKIGIDPNSYTFTRRPVKLVWYQDFTEPNEAIVFEKKIKKWSKAKKKALIEGNYDILPILSECKNDSHFKNKSVETSSDKEN